MYLFVRHGLVLKVGCSVWSTTRVVILLEVGLEGRAMVVMRLVTESCTSTAHQIIIVFGNTLLAAPDAIADDGNAAKKDGTTNSTHDTTNDLLVVISQTTAALAVALLGKRRFGNQGSTCGNVVCGRCKTGTNACHSIDDCGKFGCKDVGRDRDQRGGPSDWGGDGSRPCG